MARLAEKEVIFKPSSALEAFKTLEFLLPAALDECSFFFLLGNDVTSSASITRVGALASTIAF